MKQTHSAGGVIINKNNEILLVNEGDGFWGLPKGRIESGEEILAAALREIKEETGFTELELIKKLGSYYRHPVIAGAEDAGELKHITLFLFRTSQEIPSSNEEGNECAWVTTKQILNKLSHPQEKEFLVRARINFAMISK